METKIEFFITIIFLGVIFGCSKKDNVSIYTIYPIINITTAVGISFTMRRS